MDDDLDKIIELLEKLPDEDKVLVETGILKRVLEEAKMSPSLSDWKDELDKL